MGCGVFPDVSKDRGAFVFKWQSVQEDYFETSGTTHPTTQRHHPEDKNPLAKPV
jgi:hypothetical protein